MRLLFSTLGPFVVHRESVALPVGGRQRRVLLARLLLAANRRVDVETLLEDVWGDRVAAESRATLASHASQLRKVIGADRIDGRDRGYLLRIGDGESEAALFEAELTQGRRLLAAGDPAAAVELLERAAGRWRGPALAEVADRGWAAPEAARLEELRRLAIEVGVDAVLATGDHDRAVSLAEAAVLAEPLRERRSAQLMLALYRAGRQSDALRAYHRARSILREQLGVEPSADLAVIQAAIIRHESRLDWSPPGRDRINGVRSAPHRAPYPGPVPRPDTEPPAGATPAGAADPPAPGSSPPGGARRDGPPVRLPLRRTRFLGRTGDLARLIAEVRGRRIVTLIGPGGVGKSRMALEAAWSVPDDDFPDGRFWLDLARVERPDETLGAIATTLRVPPSDGGYSAETLVTWLGESHRLLVLDNCEHLREVIVDFVDQVASACPSATVLATSRQPMGLAGELVWPVAPLDAAASVALFQDRAAEADAALGLGEPDLRHVARICEMAEGMPLAIEIAAAHVRGMSLADIAERLPGEFPPHLADRRPVRQRASAATIGWSYRLLPADEQRLFREMSVFPATWDLAAAQAIHGPAGGTGREPDPGGDPDPGREPDPGGAATARRLGALVDKSMILADRTGARTRYRMLEPMRQFARDAARRAGIEEDLRRRHRGYYADLAVRIRADLRASGANDAAQRFVREWDNLRAAFGWAVEARDLVAAARLVRATDGWSVHAMRGEHAEWTGRALALAKELDQPDAGLYLAAAEWAYWSDQRTRALELATEAARLAPGSSVEAACAWVRVAYTQGRLDNVAAAAAALERAERALAACGDAFTFVTGHAIIHGVIGVLTPHRRTAHAAMVRRAAAGLGNPLANAIVGRMLVSGLLFDADVDAAMAEVGPAIDAARAAGAIGLETDITVLSLAPMVLGRVGPPGDIRDILARLRESGYGQLTGLALEALAISWARGNRPDLAALIIGHLDANGPRYQHPFWTHPRVEFLEPLRGEHEAAARMAQGAAMTRDEILARVMDELATVAAA